jgi:hypothetical protein
LNFNGSNQPLTFVVCKPVADSIKLFFLHFFNFADKVGHFTMNDFFLYVTNTQAYQRKTEKFFVIEEKSFIGSATGLGICGFAIF